MPLPSVRPDNCGNCADYRQSFRAIPWKRAGLEYLRPLPCSVSFLGVLAWVWRFSVLFAVLAVIVRLRAFCAVRFASWFRLPLPCRQCVKCRRVYLRQAWRFQIVQVYRVKLYGLGVIKSR